MASDLEKRIQQTGLWLYDLVEEETPSVFKKEYWTGKVMGWCMQDEAFKTEMFRFVDVFPYLTRSESVAKHLQEYFCRPEQDFPTALQWGISCVSPSSLAAKLVAKSVTNNISGMGKQFIVGATPLEAIPQLTELRSRGIAFTVDLLGEAVVSEKEADDYLRRYLDLLTVLNEAQQNWAPLSSDSGNLDWGWSPKINISLKASAMYSQMNPCAFEYSVGMAKERLRPIFTKAVEIGASVTLDMEHTALKNLTLALYRSLMEEPSFKDYPHTGIVIQSYLRDSEQDLKDLLQWSRKRKQIVNIRLVKGAYWDAEVVWASQRNWPVPVFINKHESDANFEKLASLVLQHRQWANLACASHNMRSIACVMELAKDAGIPRERQEFQILYGMAEPIRNALGKAGFPLRIYTPIGEMIPGMAYLVRRLLENTSNESFLCKSFYEGVTKEKLLRNPLELLQESPTPPTPSVESPEYGDKGPFENEPTWDWTVEENRERFSNALEKVRKKFPYKVHLFIGGKAVKAEKDFVSTNPNDPDEKVGIVASAGGAEAERAIRAAKEVFPAWRDTPPRKRAEYLFKAAETARNMRHELSALQVFEVGKTWSEADADVCEAIDFLEYYGREMIRLGQPRRMGRVLGEISQLFYEPRGVSVVIAPWNFPMAIATGMTSAAIVTGNTVIFKPASQSPVIGSMMCNLFEKAGLPKGVLNFLPGSGREIGDLLVTHPEVAFIAFTGSKDVGLRIIELTGKTPERAQGVKSVIAEMGGKNAIIVDADADLDEAVVHILHSTFGYQGQKCSACSRLIVLEENYDKLIDRLKSAAESIHLGLAEDPKTYMGAAVEPSAKEKIEEYIRIGKEEGKLLLERHWPEAKGHFVPLALFTDIRPEHHLAQDEIFGPVLAIMKVTDFDEAIEVANSTQYALTGGLFSRSPENIAKAQRAFRVGNLYINRGCTGAIVERHPFGGFKMSGLGSKAGGPDYLLHFMFPRNVIENTLRRGFAPMEERAPLLAGK